jgi:hypothetical protein
MFRVDLRLAMAKLINTVVQNVLTLFARARSGSIQLFCSLPLSGVNWPAGNVDDCSVQLEKCSSLIEPVPVWRSPVLVRARFSTNSGLRDSGLLPRQIRDLTRDLCMNF